MKIKLIIQCLIMIGVTSCSCSKAPEQNITVIAGNVTSRGETLNTNDTNNITNYDPYVNYNRNAFRMNMKLDAAVVRPVTVWYVDNTPEPIQFGVGNFYNNLRDFVTLGNDMLQLRGTDSMHTLMRVSINTTIGLFGLIDVSSSLGLDDHKNSFGTTMKVYGWEHSSYFMIPLLGPSTIRDALGLIPDTYFNPTWVVMDNNYVSAGIFTVSAIDSRSHYLGEDQLLNISLDPYMSIRDLYMQSHGETNPNSNNNNINIDELINSESNDNKDELK